MVQLGEISVPCDKDFEDLKNLCLDDKDWKLEYQKKNIKIYLKKNDLSSFQMLKSKVDFDDISASQIFDVLMDSEYRRAWDDFMVEGYDHCYVTPFSDVGYYCAKSPKPFKNRDFVMQRSWLDYGVGQDKIISAHSVNHAKIPSVKNRVRGVTYITACYIKSNSLKSCSLHYINQSDPGGSLPAWLINMTTKVLAPKFIKKVYNASLKYGKWKAKHDPEYKPWSNPETLRIPKLDMKDIIKYDLSALRDIEDESQIKENEIDSKEIENEN